MSEIGQIRLGDLLTQSPEYGANASALPPNGIDPRYLRITDIDNEGRLLHEDIRCIPKSIAAPYLLKQDDIVIARTGNTVGKSYRHVESNGMLAFAGYLVRFRFDPQKTDSKFVFHFLHSPLFWSWIGSTLRTGAQPNVNAAEYKKLPLPAFTLAHQRKIARILTALDNLIEKTESLIAKYQAVKQGMMHDLFTRGVDADGKLRPPQSEAPDLYKQSELGWIPKEWTIHVVGELAKYVNGHPFNATVWSEHGLPIIRIQNLNGSQDFNYYNGIVDSTWEVLHGDLLFAWSGMLETSFGPRIWNGPRGVLNQHIFKVLPNITLVGKNFLHLLLMHNLQRIVQSAHGFKSSFVHITRAELLPVSLSLPPRDEQEQIVRLLEKIELLLRQERQFVDHVSKIKAGLMQDLLTGKVRVKIDEEEAANV